MRDDCILIPLTKGKFAVIDAIDADIILPYKWQMVGNYAGRARLAKEKPGSFYIYMHRWIVDAPAGMQVDHINRDKLCNRRANLRIASRSQNKANSGPLANNTSGYVGVTWHGRARKWMAQTKVEKRHIYLGLFDDAADAARAYDAASREAFGEFALLNFPDHN